MPIKPQGAGGGWLAPNPEAPYRPHCYPPFWVYLGRGLNAGYWLKQRSVRIAVLPSGEQLVAIHAQGLPRIPQAVASGAARPGIGEPNAAGG